MNCFFDIDGTIVDETRFIINKAPAYLNKKLGIDTKVANYKGANVAEIFGLKDILLRKEELTTEELEQKCSQMNKGFWNPLNFVKYLFEPLRPGVKETINYLYDNKKDITFGSLRGVKPNEKDNHLSNYIRKSLVHFITMLQLRLNGIKYNKLKLFETKEEKIKFINETKPDYVFEDSLDIINGLEESIKAVCINCNHNIDSNLPNNAVRINGYENKGVLNVIEIEKQTPIEKIDNKNISSKSKILNPLFYKKCFTEKTYVLARALLGKKVAKKYQPIICGKENIPNDDRSIVYITNHRETQDQFIFALAIDQPIHWGALVRLFHGKENLFNKSNSSILRWATTAVVAGMGSVPIARATDKDFNEINLKSFRELEQYLAWGAAVGLCPEGTRNREIDKQNIHDLKSIRAFRLAADTQSWIGLVTIVWIPKRAGISNRVIVMINPPIDTKEITAKEAAELWLSMTNSNIERAKLFINELIQINKGNYSSDLVKETEREHVKVLFSKNY